MNEFPEWLPPLASLDGPTDEVLVSLYRQFLDEFRDDRCRFGSIPVRWDARPIPGQRYDFGFWHLVSNENQRSRVRSFDRRRAERLPWCAAIIRNADRPEVTVYDYRHSGRRERTYCWLQEHDFLVALEYRELWPSAAMFIVSAFYISGQKARQTIRRQYEQRIR